MKMLYKTEHNETQQNRQLANLHRKNDLSKATLSQRDSNYYGFVKTGFEKREADRKFAGAVVAPLG